MSSAFPPFAAAVRNLAPKAAVVLGSGLAGVPADFLELSPVTFGDIPGRELAVGTRPPSPYSPRLVQMMQDHEAAAGRELLAGVYAALTGPSYETPAEIRALRAGGADAVGMSTAKEAEAAVALGLEVAG